MASMEYEVDFYNGNEILREQSFSNESAQKSSDVKDINNSLQEQNSFETRNESKWRRNSTRKSSLVQVENDSLQEQVSSDAENGNKWRRNSARKSSLVQVEKDLLQEQSSFDMRKESKGRRNSAKFEIDSRDPFFSDRENRKKWRRNSARKSSVVQVEKDSQDPVSSDREIRNEWRRNSARRTSFIQIENDSFHEMKSSNVIHEQASPEKMDFNQSHDMLNDSKASMRRRLNFFFMNPCDKWRAKHIFPWKLTLQLFKLVFVTIQLVLFGVDNSSYITFKETNEIAFRHLYLNNWDTSFETLPYPPSHGQFAVYTYEQLYTTIDYACRQYNETKTLALGTYDFPKEESEPQITLCKKFYRHAKLFPFNQTYVIDRKIEFLCFDIKPVQNDVGQLEYNVEAFFRNNSLMLNFDRLIYMYLNFSVKSIHLKNEDFKGSQTSCFEFFIRIFFDNSDHSGQIPVQLMINEMKNLERCDGNETGETYSTIFIMILDVIVIIVSLVSFLLCCRSELRSLRLMRITVKYFRLHLNHDLSISDRFEFINLWYYLIIVNDVLTISGSVYKILLQKSVVDNYSVCSLLLGTGSLLVWVGVLRYLGYFDVYNLVLLTMRVAAPSLLRFLVCATVLYLGFAFCGWVVLGPYHVKFRNLLTTSECLFALINGDDMFATFAAITNNSSYIYYFSRLYVYTFVALFIYVVLNIFIALIMETYETVKNWHQDQIWGHDTPLWRFILESREDSRSPLYRQDTRLATVECTLECCTGKNLRKLLRSLFNSKKIPRNRWKKYEQID